MEDRQLLWNAVERAGLREVRCALRMEVSSANVYRWSTTALHPNTQSVRVDIGHVSTSIVRALLLAGADVAAVELWQGHTAPGPPKKDAWRLANAGANVNATDNTGRTPLHVAAGGDARRLARCGHCGRDRGPTRLWRMDTAPLGHRSSGQRRRKVGSCPVAAGCGCRYGKSREM